MKGGGWTLDPGVQKGNESVGRRERTTAVLLFVATLASVYLVYGYQWMGGDPFTDPDVIAGSAKFAGALMAILLAHEMGHYIVARRHGFSLSLPYFLPFPSAFGTFGAIIRLKSLPPNRTALLEMGAAGPLAGFVVALIALVLGLPGTIEQELPEMVMNWPPQEILPAVAENQGALDRFLTWLVSVPPLVWMVPEIQPGEIQIMILANPWIMDLLGTLMLGAPPGRYATLDPLATAGWVGCLLTAINLIPIGQLDGGHVFNALRPRLAHSVSKIGVALALLGGVLWAGWVFWGVLLLVMRAWWSLPVPTEPKPSPRSLCIAGITAVTFGLSFMLSPVEIDTLAVEEIRILTPSGEVVPSESVRVWLDQMQMETEKMETQKQESE